MKLHNFVLVEVFKTFIVALSIFLAVNIIWLCVGIVTKERELKKMEDKIEELNRMTREV